MLSPDALFGIVSMVIIGVVAWWWNLLWNKINANDNRVTLLSESLLKLELSLAKNYVQFEHFADFKREVFAKLDRIEDKIDRKEDKHEYTNRSD